MEIEVTIYTDGACSGNPGPGGWGVYLNTQNAQHEYYGYEATTTNNRMELMAAIQGLVYAKALTDHATVITDSEYVRQGIMKWIHNWRNNGWKTAAKQPVKNCDLWKTLDDTASTFTKVQWQWVKGHSGNFGNEKADQLARKAITEQQGSH